MADYPNVTVNTPADITRQARQSVDQLLGIVTALLLLAVVVAILGIVNTLALSVVERTRELGLLRAVGSTRAGPRRRASRVRPHVRARSGHRNRAGHRLPASPSRALVDEGITTVTIPTVNLLVYLVVAVAVGVLAALGPARRASRVDVLRALTAE